MNLHWERFVVRISLATVVRGVLLVAGLLGSAGAKAQTFNINGSFIPGSANFSAANTRLDPSNVSNVLPNWTLAAGPGSDSSNYPIVGVAMNPNGTGNNWSFTDTTTSSLTGASNAPSDAVLGTGYSASGNPYPSNFAYQTLRQTIPALPVAYTGNVLVGDAAIGFEDQVTQVVSGLTAGKKYTLSFYYNGSQWSGWQGSTYDVWTLNYGDASGCSATVVSTVAAGCTQVSTPQMVVGGGSTLSQAGGAWQHQSVGFVAGSTGQEFISFMASCVLNGTGSCSSGQVPPSMLLANVSLQVPEPAAWSVLMVAFGGLMVVRRRRGRTARV